MSKHGRIHRMGLVGATLAGLLAMAACTSLAPSGVANAQENAASAPVEAGWEYGMPDWAQAVTRGGAGGKVIKVTTLASDGPGSLREAIETKGPRIIVFEVGGVIDLGGDNIGVREPFVTIAGQTAPSPGITLIRGGLTIGGHDVIVQHIRIRPGDLGEAPMSGRDIDSISTQAAYNVVVDHCTLSWGTDENLSASGPRFTGETPDDWRKGTSRNVVFSNNIIAEGLSNSTHAKGEHSKGSLIHDNASDIVIYANLYTSNMERSPLFKGGVRGAVVNNFIYNPGQRAVHYNLAGLEWGDVPYETGRLTAVGNVMRGGPDTVPGLPFFTLGGSGDIEVFLDDNIAVDWFGNDLPITGRYATGRAEMIELPAPADMPDGLTPMDARDVEAYVLKNAGARPWDRDANDVRVLADAAEGRSKIIDSQEDVGGYPKAAETRREFDASLWDAETMAPLSEAALAADAKARGT